MEFMRFSPPKPEGRFPMGDRMPVVPPIGSEGEPYCPPEGAPYCVPKVPCVSPPGATPGVIPGGGAEASPVSAVAPVVSPLAGAASCAADNPAMLTTPEVMTDKSPTVRSCGTTKFRLCLRIRLDIDKRGKDVYMF